MIYYLSLGSNLGERKTYLEGAVAYLSELGDIVALSSFYETEPLGMPPQTPYFLNQAACLNCDLSPQTLLGKIKAFESRMGREPHGSHMRSRTVDIDILLAGDLVIQEKDLVIPHPEMHRRAFVLIPMEEISPGAVHPVMKKSIRELLRDLSTRKGVKKMADPLS